MEQEKNRNKGTKTVDGDIVQIVFELMQPKQGLDILKGKCKTEWKGDSRCEGIELLHICPLLPIQSAQKWQL